MAGGLAWARRKWRRAACRRGRGTAGSRADLMAAPERAGPGDAAAAALDELSQNLSYWVPGAGNGSLSGAWYRRNQIHLFGALLAILGNLIISISLNIQKYSHVQLAHQEHPRPYFKSVLWWVGVLLMVVGETGNFAAYGFAPITVIAPLGCVSVAGGPFSCFDKGKCYEIRMIGKQRTTQKRQSVSCFLSKFT